MILPKVNWFEWKHADKLDFSDNKSWKLSIALNRLEKFYNSVRYKPSFWREFYSYREKKSLLTYFQALSKEIGNKVYFNNECLNSFGSYKANTILAQLIVAKEIECTYIVLQANSLDFALSAMYLCSKLGFDYELFASKEIIEKIPQEIINKYKAKVTISQEDEIVKKWPKDSINRWLEKELNYFYIADSLNMPNPYLSMKNDVGSVHGQELKRQIFKFEQNINYLLSPTDKENNGFELFNNFIFDDTTLVSILLDIKEKALSRRFAPAFIMENPDENKREFDSIVESEYSIDDLTQTNKWLKDNFDLTVSLNSLVTLKYLKANNFRDNSVIIVNILDKPENELILQHLES